MKRDNNLLLNIILRGVRIIIQGFTILKKSPNFIYSPSISKSVLILITDIEADFHQIPTASTISITSW